MNKKLLLHKFAENVQRAVLEGKMGRSRQQLAIGLISGSRIGGLDILAMENPAGLKKALNEAEGLNLSALVPWLFDEGKPNIYSKGKLIRVEVPWPDELAELDVRLSKIQGPSAKKLSGGWVAGTDEAGRLIMPNFTLEAHWLFSGQTGSGKSVAMKSAIGQLSRAKGKNQFVLLDGKHGESMGIFSKMDGLIGPPAYSVDDTVLALTWVVQEMARRYSDIQSTLDRREWEQRTPRIIVFIDEIQTLSQHPRVAELIALLLQQGRAAKINLLISTQYPLNAIMGDPSMKQNLGGRITLKMNSLDASRVAMGAVEPDATKLLGKGDTFILAGGSFVRTQIAYLGPTELAGLPQAPPLFSSWPEVVDVEQAIEDTEGFSFSPEALALSVLAASQGEGRPSLKSRLDDAGEGRIGMTKLVALLGYGRKIWEQVSRELK